MMLFRILDRIEAIMLEKAGLKEVPVDGISERFRETRIFSEGTEIVTPESERFTKELDRLEKTIQWKAARISENREKGKDTSFQDRELGFLQDVFDAGEGFREGQDRLFGQFMKAHNEEVVKMQDMIEQLEFRVNGLQELCRIGSESEKTMIELLISKIA